MDVDVEAPAALASDAPALGAPALGAPALGAPAPVAPAPAPAPALASLDAATRAELDVLMFGDEASGLASREDVRRWYSQGLRFNVGGLAWGLAQASGGPCGLLAAIQGFLLCPLVFGLEAAEVPRAPAPTSGADAAAAAAAAATAAARAVAAALATARAAGRGRGADTDALAAVPAAECEQALAQALAFCLWQAAGGFDGAGAGSASAPVAAALVTAATRESLPLRPRGFASFSLSSSSAAPAGVPLLVVSRCTSFGELRAQCLAALPQLASDSGVMLLCYSLLLTRGVERITQRDMDEPGPLVARFGHCTQELLNLALTGEAVAGIFDGEQDMAGFDSGAVVGGGAGMGATGAGEMETGATTASGDGGGGGALDSSSSSALKLRGISRQPVVGYLSHIEAMRYGCVGSFYKRPALPLWLVGSESHYTLLWATDPAATEESPSAPLLRAFRRFEASTDCGFLAVTDSDAGVLRSLLGELGLLEAVAEREWAGASGARAPGVGGLLKAMDGASNNIVLWGEFLRFVGPLWQAAHPAAATAIAAPAARPHPALLPQGHGQSLGLGAAPLHGLASAAGMAPGPDAGASSVASAFSPPGAASMLQHPQLLPPSSSSSSATASSSSAASSAASASASSSPSPLSQAQALQDLRGILQAVFTAVCSEQYVDSGFLQAPEALATVLDMLRGAGVAVSDPVRSQLEASLRDNSCMLFDDLQSLLEPTLTLAAATAARSAASAAASAGAGRAGAPAPTPVPAAPPSPNPATSGAKRSRNNDGGIAPPASPISSDGPVTGLNALHFDLSAISPGGGGRGGAKGRAAGARAGAGRAGASGSGSDGSTVAVGDPAEAAGVDAQVPDTLDSDASASASASAFSNDGALTRTFELFHYNGLSSQAGARLRLPRLTRMRLETRDVSAGAGADSDLATMSGAGTVEEQTQLAMALSMSEADGGAGAGASAGAGAGFSADGGAPVGTAAVKAASAAEGILRTKWPCALVSFPGGPPILD